MYQYSKVCLSDVHVGIFAHQIGTPFLSPTYGHECVATCPNVSHQSDISQTYVFGQCWGSSQWLGTSSLGQTVTSVVVQFGGMLKISTMFQMLQQLSHIPIAPRLILISEILTRNDIETFSFSDKLRKNR